MLKLRFELSYKQINGKPLIQEFYTYDVQEGIKWLHFSIDSAYKHGILPNRMVASLDCEDCDFSTWINIMDYENDDRITLISRLQRIIEDRIHNMKQTFIASCHIQY